MAIYGYARCSTNEDKQDINRQIRELKDAGAEEVVFEYEHGDAKVKKELHMLLDMATAGDTIITLEVSRLSRSTQQLCEIIDVIREKHLRLVIVGSIIFHEINEPSNRRSRAFTCCLCNLYNAINTNQYYPPLSLEIKHIPSVVFLLY